MHLGLCLPLVVCIHQLLFLQTLQPGAASGGDLHPFLHQCSTRSPRTRCQASPPWDLEHWCCGLFGAALLVHCSVTCCTQLLYHTPLTRGRISATVSSLAPADLLGLVQQRPAPLRDGSQAPMLLRADLHAEVTRGLHTALRPAQLALDTCCPPAEARVILGTGHLPRSPPGLSVLHCQPCVRPSVLLPAHFIRSSS